MKGFWSAIVMIVVLFGFVVYQSIIPMTGNKTILDTTYRFDEAIVKLPDGSVITGEVEKWNDYEGDVVQVKMGGKTYLTQYSNVVLISE